MGYLLDQKRRKVSRLQRQAARCFLVTQEASNVVLAARGADREAAADVMRAIVDEAGGAVGWRVPISPATVSRILPRCEPRTSHFRRIAGTERLRTGIHD